MNLNQIFDCSIVADYKEKLFLSIRAGRNGSGIIRYRKVSFEDSKTLTMTNMMYHSQSSLWFIAKFGMMIPDKIHYDNYVTQCVCVCVCVCVFLPGSHYSQFSFRPKSRVQKVKNAKRVISDSFCSHQGHVLMSNHHQIGQKSTPYLLCVTASLRFS